MHYWLPSIALAFGPSLVLAALSMRAARKRSGSAWMDYWNAATLLGWLSNGLIILGATALPPAERLDPIFAAIFCVSALIISAVTNCAVMLVSVRQKAKDTKSGTDIGIYLFCYLGSALGISAMVLNRAFSDHSTSFVSTGVRDYVYIVVALNMGILAAIMVGAILQKRFRRQKIEDKLLAPCELNSRVREIADAKNIEVKEVKILRNLPWSGVNAFAYRASSIWLSEPLIEGLKKDEVDSVIAHEVGHLTDRLCWEPGKALRYGAFMVWLASMALVEKGIDALPQSLHILQHIKWLCLFFVPPMARMWYSRRREMKAESNVETLCTPQASISANYKLAVLNDIPMERPAWSRWLMTHPTQHERNLAIAKSSGLYASEVEEIYRRADAEIRDGSGERYEVCLYEESKREATLKRPNVARSFLLWVPFGLIGAASLVVGIAAGSSRYDNTGSFVSSGLAIISGLAVFVLFSLIIPNILRRRQGLRFRKQARELLLEKYPGQAEESMLLVDAVFTGDLKERIWQAALLGVKNGRLLILGECQKSEMDPLDISIERRKKGAPAEVYAQMVRLCCTVDSVEQQIVVKNLERPEKGLPWNMKQLFRYIQKQLIDAGMPAPKRRKRNIKQVALAALKGLGVALITAVSIGLVELLIRATNLREFDWFAYVVTALTVGPAASSLLFRKQKRRKEQTGDTEVSQNRL